MPFSVQANVNDQVVAATFETAKEAFAKAVEWHVVRRFANISINDGAKSYSIDGFSSVMALQQIADTVEADAALRAKPKGE